jgi:hypothetical protein
LGHKYHHGAGVRQDYFEAVRWFRAAAERHHPAAADNLGYMYLNGRGVSEDRALAAPQRLSRATRPLKTTLGNSTNTDWVFAGTMRFQCNGIVRPRNRDLRLPRTTWAQCTKLGWVFPRTT